MDEKTKLILIGVGVLVCIGLAYYLLGGRTADYNNVDTRLQQLEKQLSDVEAKQRETSNFIKDAQRTTGYIEGTAGRIDAGLATAQNTVDRGTRRSEAIEKSVGSITETIGQCDAIIESSRAKFAECESIFERVEQSNQKGTAGSRN